MAFDKITEVDAQKPFLYHKILIQDILRYDLNSKGGKPELFG